MTQPDLGRKISELRHAKGLTQGELAEKCNLSLRTIQRIETAEVTPRSYTVKLIFSCLDYEIYNSFGKFSYRLDRTAYKTKNWLEQLKKYVFDLFNLKTDTMKKLVILSVPCILFTSFFLFSGQDTKAQDKQKIEQTISFSNQQFVNWFNNGQIDSLGLYYLDECCIAPNNSKEIHGKEGFFGYYTFLYNSGFRFSKIESKKIIITDSIAIERGIWSAEGFFNSDIALKGNYMTQWRLIDDKWYIENEINNTYGLNQ